MTLARILLFQSTPPYGGRPAHDRIGSQGALVSIHAPVWGATWPTTTWRTSSISFNPRPRMGGDYGHSKRPEELRLAWPLREPCMGVDVTCSCNTFVSSQHLG